MNEILNGEDILMRKKRGGTRRIDDDTASKKPCMHPEHNPPPMRVFEPGRYEHICPGCGAEQTFVVRPTFS